MPTTHAKKAVSVMADLPEPHAIIAWHALNLVSSLKEEHLIHHRTNRADLAALLRDTADAITRSAQRLDLPVMKAETLRQLQNQSPRRHTN